MVMRIGCIARVCLLFEHESAAVNSAKQRNKACLRGVDCPGRSAPARDVHAINRNRRDINLLSPRESVDTHTVLRMARTAIKKADKEARPQGGLDETYATRFRGWLGRWYYRPLRHRQRTGAGRDHQDRHVRADHGPRRGSRQIRHRRRQACAGGRQQGGRRARQAARTDHRGRPDHQSRHRAGLLQAGGAVRHRRLPRFDPLDPGSCRWRRTS